MRVRKAIISGLIGLLAITLVSSPIAYAIQLSSAERQAESVYYYVASLPTLESYVNVVTEPVIYSTISEKTAEEIHEELSGLEYITDFPELTSAATKAAGKVDCGSYAIYAASLLYEKGHNPYALYFTSNSGKEHTVVIYNDGKGWGSIGGLSWDNQPPIYQTVGELAQKISEDEASNETYEGYFMDFIFQFSPEVYEGKYKIELKK